ncbi:ninjurin-B-like isoform X2 [Chironomus tepperi]|uniref:ninjurin-B-like isoform X2 n=1 Tax=Chironomus tepperi TaxID=113505 RepID=UPI00391EFC7A
MSTHAVSCHEVESHDVTDGRNRQQPASAYYHMKKSHAEGMMDLSLLTANANQLKFILYYNKDAKTFYPALVLIILSLILQIAVGILLIFRRRFKSSGQRQRASITNEYLVLLIFLTTLINILVAVFSPVENAEKPQ